MTAGNFSEISRRVETDCFGPFVFQVGVGAEVLRLPLQRVEDAYARFVASPLSQVATRLEKEMVASSVFGTNTIEGGTLTEDETAAALELDPAQVHEVEQRRVVNIKGAYDHARQAASSASWALTIDFIIQLHTLITQGIPHPDNRPGLIRDNPKNRVTYVGDSAHGGRYKPPQYGKDIRRLLEGLVAWLGELADAGVNPLVRASLAHYYYERIHPFWDGNGRVGRVIEASILQAAGYRHAPFAMAKFYLKRIDDYFTLFNTCRKAADKRQPQPNAPFVVFYLEGMLETVNDLHDRVNHLVGILLFESRCRRLLDAKEVNARQYTIVSQLMGHGPMPLDEVKHAPWYVSLYLKLNDKTRSRDLKKLRDMGLVFLDNDHMLWPGAERHSKG